MESVLKGEGGEWDLLGEEQTRKAQIRKSPRGAVTHVG